MLAVVALLLALAGGLAWLDMRRDGQALRTDVAQRLANTDAALAQAKARESDLGNELRDTQAKVALLDLHLQNGETAVMLGVRPGPGLRIALENPMRADTLFLERAAIEINDRVCLISAVAAGRVGDTLS